MKFKTYKAARNYLVDRIEKVGLDVRDMNVDRLMSEVFMSRGVGDDFELEFRPFSDTFPTTVRALRIPRRGTVGDVQWMSRVRRMGAYMGTYYAATSADDLEKELCDQALFAQHMLEEAL